MSWQNISVMVFPQIGTWIKNKLCYIVFFFNFSEARSILKETVPRIRPVIEKVPWLSNQHHAHSHFAVQRTWIFLQMFHTAWLMSNIHKQYFMFIFKPFNLLLLEKNAVISRLTKFGNMGQRFEGFIVKPEMCPKDMNPPTREFGWDG